MSEKSLQLFQKKIFIDSNIDFMRIEFNSSRLSTILRPTLSVSETGEVMSSLNDSLMISNEFIKRLIDQQTTQFKVVFHQDELSYAHGVTESAKFQMYPQLSVTYMYNSHTNYK